MCFLFWTVLLKIHTFYCSLNFEKQTRYYKKLCHLSFSLTVVSFQTTIYFGMGEVLNIFSSLILMGRILSMLPAITCYQESSVLRTKLLEHGNLVKYAEKLKMEFIEAGSSSSSVSYFESDPPSSASRRGPPNSSKIIFNSRLVFFFFPLKFVLIDFVLVG